MQDVAASELRNCVSGIQSLIEAGALEQATQKLSDALETWPLSQALKFERFRLLMAQGETDKATALLAEILKANAAPHLAKSAADMLKGQPPSPAAGRHLVNEVLSSELPDHGRHLLFEALTSPKTETAAELLAHVAERSGLHRYEFRQAVKDASAGNLQAALTLLETAREAGRSTGLSSGLHAELLSAADRHDDAVTLLSQQIETDPEDREAYRKLAKLLQRMEQHEEAAQVLERALSRWPSDWMLIQRLNRLPLDASRRTSVNALLEHDPNADFRIRLQAGIAALHDAEVERAQELLGGDDFSSLTQIRDAILAVLNRHDPDFWRDAPRQGVETGHDIAVVPREGARTVVIVPSGTAFGMLPIRMLDATLSRFDVSVIYLKDFNKRVYLRGVKSLAPDLPGTLAALDDIKQQLGASRTVYLGCSTGGFSAHRMAALSNAEAAISYAGPVDMELYTSDTKPTIWNEELLQASIISSEGNLDNRPFLRSATDTRFIHVVGGGERDQLQANLLDGLTGLERHVDLSGDHLVVNTFLADGRFDAILSDVI